MVQMFCSLNFVICYRMEDYTLKQVKRYLKTKRFQISAPKNPHKSQFTSPVWKNDFMKMIYNGDELIRSFYHCTKCSETLHVVQGPSGNSKLRRHKCWKVWWAENKPKSKPKPAPSSDSEEDDDNDDEGGPSVRNVGGGGDESESVEPNANFLARVFNDFRIVCTKPGCN